jgi:hypothetical protein
MARKIVSYSIYESRMSGDDTGDMDRNTNTSKDGALSLRFPD